MKTIRTSLNTTGYLLYLKSTLIGIITGTASIVLLLLLFSTVLMISGTLPHDLLTWFDIVACAVGCYISGYTSARITKHNALLSGTLCGVSIFLILLAAGFISGGKVTTITLIKLIVILLSCIIGSIKGVNKKQKLHIK